MNQKKIIQIISMQLLDSSLYEDIDKEKELSDSDNEL